MRSRDLRFFESTVGVFGNCLPPHISPMLDRTPSFILTSDSDVSPSRPISDRDDAVLLDMLLDWLPDDAARRKALADNPAELYGF